MLFPGSSRIMLNPPHHQPSLGGRNLVLKATLPYGPYVTTDASFCPPEPKYWQLKGAYGKNAILHSRSIPENIVPDILDDDINYVGAPAGLTNK